MCHVESVELDSRAYLTSSRDARNIVYLDTSDGYSLVVRSEKSFPNVYNVAEAEIQVRWNDIPFEEFDFEDNRQKVLRKTSADGEYEVVLKITKATPASSGVISPITDEKFAPFLEETGDYIKPGDTAIQRQLAEIKGDEKDAFRVVQRILEWISANILPDPIAETLTGPEMLKKRRGKCSDNAVLFASLARAAGIPTKVVLGEKNSGDRWIGHMWNEVWLGDWMAIDPSSGVFITDPSYVKFVESPTVMGTQRVRMKLVDNLGLEILSFREEETETPTGIETGIVGNTYTNKAFSCRISAPDETWEISETKKFGGALVRMKARGEEKVVFALRLSHAAPGVSAKTLLKSRLYAIERKLRTFKKLEEREIEIAGRKVPTALFQQLAKDRSILVNENSVLVDGTNAYLFALIAPKERFAELRVSFQSILESFQILK